jgi:hypothetical protein
MLYCEVKSPFYDIGLEFLFSIGNQHYHYTTYILHKLSKHPQACIAGINGMETDKDQQHQINKSQEEDNKQNDTITRIILYF